MKRYSVSRHTVREAIRHLSDQGRLYSLQGKGTFISPWRDQLFASRYSMAKEITKSGLIESSIVLSQCETVLERPIAFLGLEAGQGSVFVERIRRAGDEVVAINRSWFPLDIARPLIEVDLSSGSIYEFLESKCAVTVTGGWEKIRAAIPSESDCNILELSVGAPVLSLERAAYDGERPVEWRESLVRDDRFYLLAQWGSEPWRRVDLVLPAENEGNQSW